MSGKGLLKSSLKADVDIQKAKVRVLEQVRDDLADQLRKALTQIERLKLALVRYHDCKNRAFHLKSDEELGLDERLKASLKEYHDAKERIGHD